MDMENDIIPSKECESNEATPTERQTVNTQARKQHAQYKESTNVDNARKQNTIIQNHSNMDLSEEIVIPIVGYEVMEERAKFTIYKLKVEDRRRGLSWLVFRRYTDFVRLCACVQADRPSAAPPLPLPGKRWLRDNFEPVFLEDRARGLQVFVNALIKRFPTHMRVREFFCLDEPPQTHTYQPEMQAVYGALEDSMNSLKTQLKQKDSAIAYLQQRVAELENELAQCDSCSRKK